MGFQSKEDRYPTLFRLAMDVLPIQASSVPCERVFSSSKETTTARRNKLSPELMEALQMLKFSVRNGRGLNFTEGLSRDEEVKVLEIQMQHEKLAPEDFASFVESLRYKTV